jgi:hypothetical protein
LKISTIPDHHDRAHRLALLLRLVSNCTAPIHEIHTYVFVAPFDQESCSNFATPAFALRRTGNPSLCS